jgi:hypothetical protein
MSPGEQSCSAVFLVRVWLEDGLLRARMTESLDLMNRHDETVSVAGSVEEIERRLQDWLQAFAGARL